MRPKPRVRNKTKHTSVVTTVTPEITRHSPRNGFTVSFVLFPVTSLFDTVICASYRRLDASIGASEPHDFAVRVGTVRQRHRLRPPHPVPNVDDVAQRPSVGRDGANQWTDLGLLASEISEIQKLIVTPIARPSQCRPCESRDLYAAASLVGTVADGFRN